MRGYDEIAGAWLNISIKLVAACFVILFLLWPSYLPILHRVVLKMIDINIAGSHIQVVDVTTNNNAVQITDDGRLKIAGIDASDVPDTIARLQQAATDATTQYQSVKVQLESLQGRLTEEERKNVDQQIRSSNKATEEVIKVISEAGTPSIGYGGVFGGFSSLDSAMAKVQKVTDLNARIVIFKRQSSWRTVALFDTPDAARNALPALKNISSDAYIVNISKWCPVQQTVSAATTATIDCGF
ncbi:hypothetical protein EN873_17805 [bacterium M00.F.Ca.ET.230.01.1.1]|nr:hypothetical protein EN873_17805 [bacterium M00.F.Ca.ET.230.01.1.1]